MHGSRFVCRFVIPLVCQLLPVSIANAQGSLSASTCVQQGGTLQCKPAIPSAWRYRLRNDATVYFPDEASIYAHMMDSQEPASVFTLMHRWSDINPFEWPQSRAHGMQTSSWKIFRRCVPDPTEFDCDTHPGYQGYQRVREITCPAGYGFGSDPNAPYCLPLQNLPLASRSANVERMTRR